jgi:hypothetical protein
MFDWIEFLDSNSIEYSQKGSVSKNNIGINCPFCGDDMGFNLHISLQNRGWHCWRSEDHRGTTPHRIIQNLLKCSYEEACNIVGSEVFFPLDVDYSDYVKNLIYPSNNKYKIKPRSLEIPKNFYPLEDVARGHLFISYLRRRGFEDWQHLTEKYDIYMAIGGEFDNRIIFIVKMDGKPMVWSGRSIARSDLRYRSLSVNDNPPALVPIKESLLWYDLLKYNDGTLVVCEGPFDALKINYFGNKYGIYATCLFGLTVSDVQLDLLESLIYFKTKILVLDRKESFSLKYFNPLNDNFVRLNQIGFTPKILPKGIKDPGELTQKTFTEVFLS